MRELYTNGPFVATLHYGGSIGTDPYGDTPEYYEYTWDNPERHFYFDVAKSNMLVIGWSTLASGAPAWIV